MFNIKIFLTDSKKGERQIMANIKTKADAEKKLTKSTKTSTATEKKSTKSAKTSTKSKKASTSKKTTSTGSSVKKKASSSESSAKKKASSSESSVKLTTTEKKLLELYRAADADTKKAAMALLKGEKTQLGSILDSILENKKIMNTVTSLFK